MRRRWAAFAPMGWCTPVPARARRSRPGKRSGDGRGAGPGARGAADRWSCRRDAPGGRATEGPATEGPEPAGGAGDDSLGTGLRVAVGAGMERWVDLLGGPLADDPASGGDLLVRDRVGNWTYPFCVVVDDMRNDVDLVIRGRDLLHSTPVQLRLARLLGRGTPPRFLHHPLVRRESGQKLSKADGATAVRSLLDAGATPGALFGRAARLAGLRADDSPIEPGDLATLFR